MSLDWRSRFRRIFGASRSGPDLRSIVARRRVSLPESRQGVRRRTRLVASQRESVGDTGRVAPRLEPALSWAYQLQHIDSKVIAACPADVVVMDTSPDGDWRTAFTAQDIQAMKLRPGDGAADKKVIAYMSIGEAEIQRFYWQAGWVQRGKKTSSAPGWLHEPNDQGWVGNWKVRFWDPDWQRNILGGTDSFLDRIIDQGFDGVYLDIIDAYDYWLSDERGRGRRPTAAEEMVTFVRRIADHARVNRGKPDFAVIPQNGEGLLIYPQYRAAISAIGKEDILYDQFGKANAKPHVRPRPEQGGERGEGVEDIMENLRHALADRIPILSVEYLLDWPEDRGKMGPALQRMRRLGLIPHFGVRDLGRLSETIPPPAGGVPVS